MKNITSSMRRWRNYYSQVSDRISFDRSFISSASMVTKIYLHYAYKNLIRSAKKLKVERHHTLAFYPNPAGPWYTIWMALQSTNINIISSAETADVIFIFDDKTKTKTDYVLKNRSQLQINTRATDISKVHVAKIFEEIFKYPLSVDPLTYEGQAVCKADENGVHDGYLISLPIPQNKVKPSCVYQRLVDSTFDGNRSEDLRIAYVFGSIPVVYHKFKALNKRFSTTYLSTTLRLADDVFSSDEIKNITDFCQAMGLDFGSLDVMRDKTTNLIYIVDVNKTCMPVLSLSKGELLSAMERIGTAFEAHIDQISERS